MSWGLGRQRGSGGARTHAGSQEPGIGRGERSREPRGCCCRRGRRMGRSWGAGCPGRRGLKGRRAQVRFPSRQAIGKPPTLELAVATLPRALRRPGRGHGEISVRDVELSVVAGPLGAAEGGWAEGASLQDPRKFPGSARGRVPSVSLLSLRRCGHAGSRSCWWRSPGSTPR